MFRLLFAVLLLGGMLAVAAVRLSFPETAVPSSSPETTAEEPCVRCEFAPEPKTMEGPVTDLPEPGERKPVAVQEPKPPAPSRDPEEKTLAPTGPVEKQFPQNTAAPVPIPSLPQAGDKLEARALARLIDSEIQKKLDSAQAKSAPLADDAEFLRRVYLDLHGVVPLAEKAAAFLDSKDPAKRAKLIDELLADPQFGRYLADVYAYRLLIPNPEPASKPIEPLRDWLAEAFNRNQPWNELAAAVITATGSPIKIGPARFYTDGPAGQLALADLTNTVASTFLGVQVKCAQCHDHPFAKEFLKESDYWGLAAFFVNVGYANREIQETNKVSSRRGFLPDNYRQAAPKFLGGAQPPLEAAPSRRQVFARWATAPENPYFAKALVNRMWGHFFARGFVNPVDDLRPDKPASHPELLEALSGQFVAHGFDLKFLLRAICNTQTYQRSSRRQEGDEVDPQLFGIMAIKVLTAEQLYDSLVAVMGGTPTGVGAFKNSPRTGFVNFFETAAEDPTAYGRGIPHMLRLMNSGEFRQHQAKMLGQVAPAGRPPAQAIEQLYLAVLSRRPSVQERERMVAFVQRQGGNTQTAFGQVLWVLLNSSEFMVNR